MNKPDGKASTPSLPRKAGRIMLATFSILLAAMLGLIGLLEAWSLPGKPEPFVDTNGEILAGSLSEKIRVPINGIEQGMFVKSKDVRNPVLLYLHGGMPDYFLADKYPTGLEEHFTVVWWEQRGSGLSYSPDIPRETLTLEQMISDTLAITNYLRQRFDKEKIYLMGHSGGTFIGIQAAARAPELYYAYIGVAQMSNQLNSEKIAYDYMLQQFQEKGDTNMVQRLEATPVTLTGGTPKAYELVRDQAMHGLGIGTMHEMNSIVTGIILPSFQCRDYTLKEKFDLWHGKATSGIATLWHEMSAIDLSQTVTEFQIPVYFMGGVYDYTVNYALAKDYFDKIHAPVKGFYTFEHSAHSPMFEEPEKTLQILLQDVLTRSNNLADDE